MTRFQLFHASAKTKKGRIATGNLGQGRMNKTEALYALDLDLRHQTGEIAWWAFESMKFRLADKTFYTPDFAVMLASGELEIHEVKGHWEDDARVKIKVAADRFPFRFLALRQTKNGWEREVF